MKDKKLLIVYTWKNSGYVLIFQTRAPLQDVAKLVHTLTKHKECQRGLLESQVKIELTKYRENFSALTMQIFWINKSPANLEFIDKLIGYFFIQNTMDLSKTLSKLYLCI